MTVGELIEELQKLPQNASVIVCNKKTGCSREVSGIEEKHSTNRSREVLYKICSK